MPKPVATLCGALLLLAAPLQAQHFVGEPWPEADRLFRRNSRWLGGDAAYSIALGPDRILWLFGDSWIAPAGRPTRTAAQLVSNSIAIQHGPDPSRATIRFYWGASRSGSPTEFFSPSGRQRLWPAHGIRFKDHLLLFFMGVVGSPDPLGFRIQGWKAVLVLNPDSDPSRWQLVWLPNPTLHLQVVPGGGGVLAEGDYVYAFSPQEPGPQHTVYLLRWRRTQAEAGNLAHPEWWQDPTGWIPDSALTGTPTPLFREAQTEFSVHRDQDSGVYLSFQSLGFGQAVLGMRAASALTGSWQLRDTVYVPPETARSDILIYAGKAHPELQGADLILTYATNLPFSRQRTDTTIYYPRFVRLRHIP